MRRYQCIKYLLNITTSNEAREYIKTALTYVDQSMSILRLFRKAIAVVTAPNISLDYDTFLDVHVALCNDTSKLKPIDHRGFSPGRKQDTVSMPEYGYLGLGFTVYMLCGGLG